MWVSHGHGQLFARTGREVGGLEREVVIGPHLRRLIDTSHLDSRDVVVRVVALSLAVLQRGGVPVLGDIMPHFPERSGIIAIDGIPGRLSLMNEVRAGEIWDSSVGIPVRKIGPAFISHQVTVVLAVISLPAPAGRPFVLRPIRPTGWTRLDVLVLVVMGPHVVADFVDRGIARACLLHTRQGKPPIVPSISVC